MIVEETFTDPKFQGCKELDKLVKAVKYGDTIIFDSISRMSRNADYCFKLYQELYNSGVELIFLKEPHINMSTYRKTFREKKILLNLNSGYKVTNALIRLVLDALNDYFLTLVLG